MAIEDDVIALQATVATLQTQITALESLTAAHTGNLSALLDADAAFQNDIDSMQTMHAQTPQQIYRQLKLHMKQRVTT